MSYINLKTTTTKLLHSKKFKKYNTLKFNKRQKKV